MKTVTCATMFGCLFFMMGASCLAVDTAENKTPTENGAQVAELGAIKQNDHLRAWVDSIKPAAGHVEPVHQESGYWDKSVKRENRGHLQE